MNTHSSLIVNDIVAGKEHDAALQEEDCNHSNLSLIWFLWDVQNSLYRLNWGIFSYFIIIFYYQNFEAEKSI